MVVQVIAEQLNMTDGGGSDIGGGKMAREEDKGDVANIFRIDETWKMTNLKRRLMCGVEHLRSALDGRQATSIDKFLQYKQ